MEAFGIALYALGGLLAAPLFCLLIARYSRRFSHSQPSPGGEAQVF
jgi:hypothetical protein